jgi:hypothetical protein
MKNYNPWLDIPAKVYEMHMSDSDVFQLQTLNRIMKLQIEDYSPYTMAIFGVATGNGLEHAINIKKVYAIDINDKFLNICKERYCINENISFLKLDIQNDDYDFQKIELAICNLILEFINENIFIKKISEKLADNGILSAVFQVNQGADYISKTKYSDAFSILNKVHHNVNEEDITKIMEYNKLIKIKREEYVLPNNKKLVRIDYKKYSPSAGKP